MQTLALLDTHTHFDVPDFDADRTQLAQQAKQAGVQALVLIGFLQTRFADLVQTHHWLNALDHAPKSLLAPGLHPFYIEQHAIDHLLDLERLLVHESCAAIGEIGLDSFLKAHKQPDVFAKQQQFFNVQMDMARQHQKPILLHIRKSHAEALQMLKQQKFEFGGIAHAFSGGAEEAKAFVKLGFKIGVTGQITNPNAKKLHAAVQAVGAAHVVLETDCPDMTPLCCQLDSSERTRNTPVNLPYVLQGLAQSLGADEAELARQLWRNSLQALHLPADF